MPLRSPFRAVLLLAASLAACAETAPEPPGDAPLLAFDSARIRLATATDTLPLRVEVAATPDQRAVGLMERTALAEDAGMLFLHPAEQAGDRGFWMFHTRIPLDIAYLDAGGRIVAMRTMQPCASPDPRWCETYAPGVPYHAALEVNAGWFQRHGVREGDRVLLPDAGLPTPR